MYFDSERQVCKMYSDRPVAPDMVCDSFMPVEPKPVTLDNE